jgi:hypothetical protein
MVKLAALLPDFQREAALAGALRRETSRFDRGRMLMFFRN